MLESVAKTKVCPILSANSGSASYTVKCLTDGCMMWEEWQEPIHSGEGIRKQVTGYRLFDPRQGDCGEKSVCNGCTYPG